METTTGFFFAARTISAFIASDAIAEPPGLVTLNIMASMSSSSASLCMSFAYCFGVIPLMVRSDSSIMFPSALTKAIFLSQNLALGGSEEYAFMETIFSFSLPTRYSTNSSQCMNESIIAIGMVFPS